MPLTVCYQRFFLCFVLFFAFTASVDQQDISEIPLLKEQPQSKNYQLRFLHNPYEANISFDQRLSFFISQGRHYIKIDADGRVIFRLPATPESFRPPLSHFVVAEEGIYDLTADDPKAQSIVQIVDGEKGRRLKKESFEEVFRQAYRDADIFFVGEFDSEVGKKASYFRIEGNWVKFYLDVAQGFGFVDQADLRDGLGGFPAKYERMTLLKDIAREEYSYEKDELMNLASGIPEASIVYSELPTIQSISYSSETVIENFVHTSAPAWYAGWGHYRLFFGKEHIDFKELATREVSSPQVETKISLFVLPANEAKRVKVSFLKFSPLTSDDTKGSDGLYIVSPQP